MAHQLLIIVLCFLTMGHYVVGSLQLDVVPGTIIPGLTPLLTINCTFSYQSLPSVASIMSLIISMAEQDPEGMKFNEVASLSTFAADQAVQLSHVNASVAGHIDANGESFLSLQWEYPSRSENGLYRCDAHAMDIVGHPLDITETSQVILQEPDLGAMIKEFTSFKSALELQLVEQSHIISQLQTELVNQEKNLSDTITRLQSELESQMKKQSVMIAAMFEKTVDYKGRYYLLSKQYWMNVDVAEVICEHYGGYLAEIDDADEHTFIKNFLGQFGDTITVVLVGGTDETLNGTWVFRFSRRPLTYTDWYGNEPDTPDRHCMNLHRAIGWQMEDFPCYDFTAYLNKHFLCEVPID